MLLLWSSSQWLPYFLVSINPPGGSSYLHLSLISGWAPNPHTTYRSVPYPPWFRKKLTKNNGLLIQTNLNHSPPPPLYRRCWFPIYFTVLMICRKFAKKVLLARMTVLYQITWKWRSKFYKISFKFLFFPSSPRICVPGIRFKLKIMKDWRLKLKEGFSCSNLIICRAGSD